MKRRHRELFFRIALIIASVLLPLKLVAQSSDDDEFSFKDETAPQIQKSLKQKQTHAKGGKSKVSNQSSIASSPWHFLIGIGYHSADKTVFSSVTSNVSSNSSEATFFSNSAYEITLGLIHTRADSIGGFGHLTYQSERQIHRIERSSGTVTTYSDAKPSIQIFLLEAGGFYRWTSLYVPIGFNYSLVSFSDVDNVTNSKTSVNGALGYQGGVGYIFARHFIIEALFKIIAVESKTEGAVITLSQGTGYTSGPAVQIKYGF